MHFSIKNNLLVALLKGAILFLTAFGVIFAARFFELEAFYTPLWIEEHLQQGVQGIALFIFMAAICSALGVPRQAMAFLGGFAFGPFYGLLWTCIGLGCGCSCGFFYARFLGQSLVQRKLGTRIATLNSFLCSNPFLMAIAIRFFPLGNNALTNLAAGVSAIPALPFILGSSIGYLPQSIVFALLGSGIQLGEHTQIVISCLLFTATSLLGFLLLRRFKADKAAKDAASGS